jgi:hypothetical protein
MSAISDLRDLAAFLAAQTPARPSRRAVLSDMFCQRYGARGPELTSFAAVGQQHGVSRQAAQKSVGAMLELRWRIPPEMAPTVRAVYLEGAKSRRASTVLSKEDLTRLAQDVFGVSRPRHGACKYGSACETSRVKITEDQFTTLMEFGVVRAVGKVAPAAKLILLEGWSPSQACDAVGCRASLGRAAVDRVVQALRMVQAAYGHAERQTHPDRPVDTVRLGRPRAPHRIRITDLQFEVLLDLGAGRRGNPAIEAARQILVRDAHIVDASREFDVTPQRANEARRRLTTAHRKLLDVFGR